MKLHVVENRRNSVDVLSFVYLSQGMKIPCYYSRDLTQPKLGSEVEVMFTGFLFAEKEVETPMSMRLSKDDKLNKVPDYNRLRCFFIREIQPEDILVYHKGFEMVGTMCTTTATAYFNEERTGPYQTITPGRVPVYYVDNVSSNRGEEKPRIPGVGWARKHPTSVGFLRLEGVTRPDDFYNVYNRFSFAV